MRPKLNLEDVFKKVFRYSVHDQENISYYDVVIHDFTDPDLALSNYTYFRGWNIANWLEVEGGFPLNFLYRGHTYIVRPDFYDEEYDSNKNLLDEFGRCYVNIKYKDSVIFFREVLRDTEKYKYGDVFS